MLTLRHAATYGLGTALSSALGELWDPPLWQKALIYCAVFASAWGALKWFKRRPP